MISNSYKSQLITENVLKCVASSLKCLKEILECLLVRAKRVINVRFLITIQVDGSNLH